MPGFTPPNDAGNKPRDYIGLADLRDIKAALHGKPVDPTTGKVDHAAPATTPHLRLSATWYTSQMKDLAAHKDRQQMMGLIDVVNLFIMEQSVPAAEQYATDLQTVRALVGPDVALVAGAFLFNSAIDWADPASFRAILNASIDAYDAGEIEGESQRWRRVYSPPADTLAEVVLRDRRYDVVLRQRAEPRLHERNAMARMAPARDPRC